MAQEMFMMVPSGQIVFREGDDGTEMYIIESGAIDIVRAARGSEPLATLGPGDFFGEMAILEDQPRFASAIARAPTKLLRIDRAAFPGVIAGNVEIAVRIMRKLAGRVRGDANWRNHRSAAGRSPSRRRVGGRVHADAESLVATVRSGGVAGGCGNSGSPALLGPSG